MKILLSIWTILLCNVIDAHAAPAPTPPAMQDYATVLLNLCDDDGLVNYGELMLHPAGLERVLAWIAGTAQSEYDGWSEPDRIAFWINAYNAFALKLIVDHYPIQPSTGKTQFPANSIRQIPGAWEHKKFKALGRDVTLDEIEHQILRVKFQEPRIHMALVNASMSAPKLRREPYVGADLDTQLDDQTKVFFSDLRNFLIERDAKEVWASPIFEWFVDDFLPEATQNNPRHIAQQKSLSAFAAKYVSPEDARYLAEGDYVVKYYDYDWTLNEQPQ